MCVPQFPLPRIRWLLPAVLLLLLLPLAGLQAQTLEIEIRDVRFEGDRAFLVLEGGDGRAYLMLVDMTSGERISLVVLEE
jgi:hypothetical protein